MPQLLDTLRAVPRAKVASMQAALRRAWPRFSYLSVAAAEFRRRGQPVPAAVDDAARRDAVATLLQVLQARAQLRAARAAGAPGDGVSDELQPAAGCAADALGADVSPPDAPGGAEPHWIGRVVNGWTI
jgi:hypothetical protein